jgi:hypothetical protein
LLEAADPTTMPRKVSRNRHEDYIDHFPGTAEEKQSFQEWLKQIPWLHPDHVTLWFAEEMMSTCRRMMVMDIIQLSGRLYATLQLISKM